MITIAFNNSYTDEAKKELYEMLAREKRYLEQYCDGYCTKCEYREFCRDLIFSTGYLKEKLGL